VHIWVYIHINVYTHTHVCVCARVCTCNVMLIALRSSYLVYFHLIIWWFSYVFFPTMVRVLDLLQHPFIVDVDVRIQIVYAIHELSSKWELFVLFSYVELNQQINWVLWLEDKNYRRTGIHGGFNVHGAWKWLCS